jgi:uncharacterized membrane protein
MMTKLIGFLFLSLLCIGNWNCKTDVAAPPAPITISIGGKVTDSKTTAPLDSIYITIEANHGVSTPTPTASYYSDKAGNYAFQLITKTGYAYNLVFEKVGKNTITQPVAPDKTNQVFNISL